VTEPVDWSREAQAVEAQLGLIEQAAVEGVIPPEAMTAVKSAVDHCRTTLWAAATASSSDADSARTAAILAARLARVEEMCNRIVEEVAKGHIWVGTAGLGRFVATLDVTERCIKALLQESASARSE
jgi:hypothetical protein